MSPRLIKNNFPGVYCATCRKALPVGALFYHYAEGPRGQKMFCSMECFDKRSKDAPKENETPITPTITPVTPSTTQVTPKQESKQEARSPLAAMIAEEIKPYLDTKLDETRVLELIAEHTKSETYEIVVKNLELDTQVNVGKQHFLFEKLLKYMQTRLNIWIAGPSGSGKSKAFENAARALGLPFAFTGAIVDTFNIFGFKSGTTGTYMRTPFREIWENGGVFLFDDFDASDPVAAVELNNMLANGSCAFPDGMVPKHKTTILGLSANTWGSGATNEYVGRNKQDAAFISRFAFLLWPYDEVLESETCGNIAWAKRVQYLRHNATAKGLKVLITPRASYNGAKLLAAGLDQTDVEYATIRNLMTETQWASIQ